MADPVSEAVVSGIASKIIEIVVVPIRREISYVFKYKSFVDKLRSPVGDLKSRRQRLEQAVEDAERQGDVIYDDVQQWLIEMNKFIETAEKLIHEREDNAMNKRCFKGLCPDLMTRRKLSKEAVNAEKDANNLLAKGNFSNVSYRPAPQRIEFINVVRGYQQFDSRKKVFQDVMEALRDSNANMIGVYGMGGVGKTTLVKEVEKKVIEAELFDEVVMVEVTQNPDSNILREKIAHDLGIKFDQNENEYDRADRLSRILKKEKRFLIILDNIWAELKLEAIGIPFGGEYLGRSKILLTSRSRHVLCNEMNSQKNFLIDVLSDEEGMSLFWKTMGDHPKKTSNFQSLAPEIVGKCGGLPIAIETIGRALKDGDHPFWKDALTLLRNTSPKQIQGMAANVYSPIELSYKLLANDEAKSLFLHCGLLNDGSRIPVNHLLWYGMGLGLFKKINTLEEGRNRVHSLIHNLKDSCLLLDGDTANEVKMHDVIHAVAVSVAEDELMFNIHNIVDLEKGLEDGTAKDATVISLPYGDIQELPERLECPKLKSFLLFEKYGNSLQIPDPFFEELRQLKILHVTQIHFSSLPSSLDCLLNLRTLLFINCSLEGDVAIVGELKKLEILSFRSSDIEQLPSEIGRLTRLKLLDLGNCLKLEVIAPKVISKLSQLEELYMGNSFTRWEEVEGKSNASLVELKGLSKLRILEVHIRHVQSIRQDLVSVQLERFRIFIGDMWDWSGKHDTSRILKFSGLGENIYLGNEMRKLLTRTEHLSLDKLDGVQNLFDELADGKDFINFNQLNSLTLRGMPQLTSSGFNMEITQGLSTTQSTSTEIVAEDDSEDFNTILFNNKVNFPTLKKLKLSSLNVTKIWLDQFSAMSTAKNLRKLKVEECSRLKFLLSYSAVNSLVHLQELVIGKCESMEGIIDDTTKLGRDEEQMVFPKLEHLKLSDLPALTRFSIGINSQFPSLRELWIYKCLNLKSFISMSSAEEDHILHTTIKPLFDEKVGLPSLEELRVEKMDNLRKIWHHQLDSESFRKLRNLKVIDCHQLMNIFPLNIVMGRRFERLEGLFVRWCNSIEEIIEVVAEEFPSTSSSSSRFDVFPQLISLELSNLPTLRSVSQGTHSFEWPMLKNLWLFGCGKVEILFASSDFLSQKMESQKPLFLVDRHKVAFPTLKTLEVLMCAGLRNLVTLSAVESLGKLVRMKIIDNIMIEKIIEMQVEEANENTIVFSQLEYLELGSLPIIESFCSGNCTLEFPYLEQVVLSGCPSMKTFSAGVLRTPKLHKLQLAKEERWEGNLNLTIERLFERMAKFCGLKYLKLSQFPRVREIWHDQVLPVSFFNNLRWLVVDGCPFMLSAIPANLLQFLNNLETLEVRNCDSIEEVFHLEDFIADRYFGPLFPKLENLKLVDLPKLRRFCDFNCSVSEMPKLDGLLIKNCSNMETFISNENLTKKNKLQEMTSADEDLLAKDSQSLFDKKVRLPNLEKLEISCMDKLRKIWQDELTSNSFCELKYLRIEKCKQLLNIFPRNMLERLQKLENLEVNDCDSVQGIVELQEINVLDAQAGPSKKAVPRFVFPKLTLLYLLSLRKLESFYGGEYILEWPMLKNLRVGGCYVVRILFASESSSLQKMHADSRHDKMHEFYYEDELMEPDYFKSSKPLFSVDTVRFQGLEKLEVSSMHNLRKIWQDELTSNSFCELKHLRIETCERLLNIFPRNMLERLQKLENLEVNDCYSMRGIVKPHEINVLDAHVGPSKEVVPRFVFPKLTSLQFLYLPRLQSFYGGEYILEWPMLKNLRVERCGEVRILFASESLKLQEMHADSQHNTMHERTQRDYFRSFKPLFSVDAVRFQGLEKLEISSLYNLEKIWRDELTSNSFCELNYLRIKNCKRLLNIFPRNMLERLRKLENLEVNGCYSMQGIVEPQEINVLDAQVGPLKEVVPRFVFPKLTSLQFLYLPRLQSFYGGEYILEWPMLKNLRVEGCDEVRILFALESLSLQEMHADSQHDFPTPLFFVDMVAFSSLRDLDLCNLPKLLHLWKENSQPSKVFQNLQNLKIVRCADLEKLVPSSVPLENLMTLEVSWCNRLRSLVTLKTAESLVKLMSMKLINCEMMVQIIEMHVGEEVEEDPIIIFSQLQYLKLDNLPRLESFYLGNYTLAFPSLEEVAMGGCLSMKIFSEGALRTPKLNKVQLSKDHEEEYEEWWEGNLNSTIQKMFQEKAGFCRFRLKTIWQGALSFNSSGNLRELVLDDWPFTSPAIPGNMLWFLNNLEYMTVRNCKSVEEVFHLEDLNAYEHFGPLFPKLECLSLEHLGNLKGFCNFNGNIIELPKLELLRIKNCPNMETFISNPMAVQVTTNKEFQEITLEANLMANYSTQPLFDGKIRLPNLERLTICGMPNMRKIWQDQFAMDFFCKLENLQIEGCSTILNIFPWTMLGRLKKLEKLEVLNCDSVLEILEVTDAQVGEAVPSFVFPQLTSLTLRSLPKLRSFYPGVHISSWPLLKRLEVTGCAEVEILASDFLCLRETDGNSQHDMQITPQPLFFVDTLVLPILEELKLSELPNLLHLCKENACPSDVFQNLKALTISECSKLPQLVPPFWSFQNLKTLKVSKCDELISLMTLLTAKSLVQLQSMEITYCKMIQEIIQEVGEMENDCIVFSQLKYLRLDYLPSLSGFYLGNRILEFPSLQKVIVRNCPNMEIFSRGILSTPLLQRVQQTEITFYNVHWEGSLNSTIQKLFEEKNVQSS